MIKIALIGLGNLGCHLAKKIGELNDIELTAVGRNKKEDLNFCIQNDLKYTDEITNYLIFDLVLICVNDDAIIDLAASIPETTPVAYTSGALELNRINRKNKGVFYPLQTFQKSQAIEFENIPFFIEADHQNLEKELVQLAQRLSNQVTVADSDYRKKLHMAAVFANNFTNFMLTQSADFLESENIPFSHLFPLLEKTIENVKIKHPKHLQTGPAKRNDLDTIKHHKALLGKNQQDIYSYLSEQIKNYYEEL